MIIHSYRGRGVCVKRSAVNSLRPNRRSCVANEFQHKEIVHGEAIPQGTRHNDVVISVDGYRIRTTASGSSAYQPRPLYGPSATSKPDDRDLPVTCARGYDIFIRSQRDR